MEKGGKTGTVLAQNDIATKVTKPYPKIGKRGWSPLNLCTEQNHVHGNTSFECMPICLHHSHKPKQPTTIITNFSSSIHFNPRRTRTRPGLQSTSIARSYKVVIEHEGESTELEVDPDETILSKAIDSGLTVPHDCKLGVCMTCPAKLLSGTVDQSEGMLSDDVVERGFALLCAAYPRSDCHIKTIPEEELLSMQLATADD
ncbi:hypothetical protein LWI28_004918 [Acer negundo]|uniref:Ferredoxin n=1 Tax=Acer negundo TaxID=4023 RepID=A0AAD5JCF7_ACENE|nr:hypothetical protein LWI28_004918 [Acer negundo]